MPTTTTTEKLGEEKKKNPWPLCRGRGDERRWGGVAAYQRCWFDCGKALSVPVVEGLILHWLGRPHLRPAIPVAHLIPYKYMILQKWIKTRRKSGCALPAAAASLSPLCLHKRRCLRGIVQLSASPGSSHGTKWISNTLQAWVRRVSWSLAGCLLNPWLFFFFFKPPVLHMCKKKKTQKHKAMQSNRTPRKGRVQALQLSNPIKNVISMSSKDDAFPF